MEWGEGNKFTKAININPTSVVLHHDSRANKIGTACYSIWFCYFIPIKFLIRIYDNVLLSVLNLIQFFQFDY